MAEDCCFENWNSDWGLSIPLWIVFVIIAKLRVEFSAKELLTQQIMGLALGYEDLNDHDILRSDRLLALIVGRSDITGRNSSRLRRRRSARGY